MKFKCKVITRASKNEIIGIENLNQLKIDFKNKKRENIMPELKVYLTTAPTKGKANEALISLLSEKLGLNKSKITVIKGEKSNKKVIEIEGIENDFKSPTA